MSYTSRHDETARAALEAFRDALAELVQIGMSVARMVGRVAEAETALAVAFSKEAVSPDDLPLATSLAEAIEADRATAAAAAAQQTMIGRTEAVARAFRVVSRSVRMTVALAERLDRGWARPNAERDVADDRDAMARRQIARAVADAIGREADGERAERLSEALTERMERMERLDVEAAIGNRPTEEIITEICRDLGLDGARMIVRLPLKGFAGRDAGPGEQTVASLLGDGGTGWKAGAKPPPDG